MSMILVVKLLQPMSNTSDQLLALCHIIRWSSSKHCSCHVQGEYHGQE